jgi:hypothetical protein
MKNLDIIRNVSVDLNFPRHWNVDDHKVWKVWAERIKRENQPYSLGVIEDETTGWNVNSVSFCVFAFTSEEMLDATIDWCREQLTAAAEQVKKIDLVTVKLTAVAPQNVAGDFAQFLTQSIQNAKDNGDFHSVAFDVNVVSDGPTVVVSDDEYDHLTKIPVQPTEEQKATIRQTQQMGYFQGKQNGT